MESTIMLGGQAYTALPLSLGDWKRLKATIKAVAEGQLSDVDQVMDAAVDVIHASLKRAQPDLPRALIEDHVDWHSAQLHYANVLQLSMPQAAPGETPAASQSGASTGT